MSSVCLGGMEYGKMDNIFIDSEFSVRNQHYCTLKTEYQETYTKF
jgi:hypothetical protein